MQQRFLRAHLRFGFAVRPISISPEGRSSTLQSECVALRHAKSFRSPNKGFLQCCGPLHDTGHCGPVRKADGGRAESLYYCRDCAAWRGLSPHAVSYPPVNVSSELRVWLLNWIQSLWSPIRFDARYGTEKPRPVGSWQQFTRQTELFKNGNKNNILEVNFGHGCVLFVQHPAEKGWCWVLPSGSFVACAEVLGNCDGATEGGIPRSSRFRWFA
jgi:hypothetical protein